MKATSLVSVFTVVFLGVTVTSLSGQGFLDERREGRRLFEEETFGGNGRTCLTCHSRRTGTVSVPDAVRRFLANPQDPLFLHDGSDDGQGNGVTRITGDATILMSIPLHPSVQLPDPSQRSVTLRRGIPTTLNTPAMDPVLMLDGRQPTLELQAQGAILDHAQAPGFPTLRDLELIKKFQMTTDAFFSSPALRLLALGGPSVGLPRGRTASERRGRVFFEDVPPNPAAGFKPGLCSHCHSGSLLNQTNEFAPVFVGVPIPTGTRFVNILVSEFNVAGNPVMPFIFNKGTPAEVTLMSPDPGRALVTGNLADVGAFKISQLRGIRHTAPYFHDNSAKTLEDVARHYTRFFRTVTGDNLQLTPQDEADMVAFMKLLD